MPWKTSSVVDERARFILEYERNEQTMTDLCEIYQISRTTGYYWLERYRQGGLDALKDLSRAPERHPNQTASSAEAAILELRRAHMRWGPRKLKKVLERRVPGTVWPAASTIGGMLAREGLTVPRKKRRRVPPYTTPFAAAGGPNRVWCADFKGWFKAQNGTRIDPLTISDAYSRYLLRCQQVAKTNGEQVQAIFEAAFREYGLPQAIRTDNGAPFASQAIAGLSRLAVWCVVDETGNRARAHRGGPPGAKRETRAGASHVETRDGVAAGSESASTAGGV